MKRTITLMLAGVLTMTAGTVVSYADVVSNVSFWAEHSVNIAYNRDFVTVKAYETAKDPITRVDFCEIIVNFYETVLGEEVTKEIESPFSDTDDRSVLIAYDAGIISGTSATTFSPNSFLTREQLAIILVRTLETLEIDLVVSDENPFPDIVDLPEFSQEVINKLYASRILSGGSDGNFHPKDNLTVEESIVGFVNALWYYETIKNQQLANMEDEVEEPQLSAEELQERTLYHTVEVAGNSISLGQSRSEIEELLGEPTRLDMTPHHLDRYIYHTNYKNYFYITFVDDLVAEVFMPTNNFQYLDLDGDSSTLQDVQEYSVSSLSALKEVIKYSGSQVDIYLDYKDSLSAIHLRDTVLFEEEYANNSVHMEDPSYLKFGLLDLIQAKRRESNLQMLQEDAVLTTVAQNHTTDMVVNQFFSPTGSDGSSPFERFQAAEVSFKSATELLGKTDNDLIDIYTGWLTSPAELATITNPSFSHYGIGYYQNLPTVYFTIDLRS
ncbi:MAG: S-layer homology domain-containing protein [Bacillota bacterium]